MSNKIFEIDSDIEVSEEPEQSTEVVDKNPKCPKVKPNTKVLDPKMIILKK